MEYASKGVAGAGLGTGIAGLSLGVLNSMGGLLGTGLANSLGYANGSKIPEWVSKEEFTMGQELAKKDSEIALLKADNDTDKKLVEVYAKLESRDKEIRQEISAFKDLQYGINAQQGVVNAQVAANIAVAQNSITDINTTLSNITKTVVPITSVCPEPMPAKNSWTAPTTTTTT